MTNRTITIIFLSIWLGFLMGWPYGKLDGVCVIPVMEAME